MYLAVPETPADVLDRICKADTFLAVFISSIRPTFDALDKVVDAHRQVELVEHITGRANACRLSLPPRSVGAIAENGDFRARCCTKAVQHAA